MTAGDIVSMEIPSLTDQEIDSMHAFRLGLMAIGLGVVLVLGSSPAQSADRPRDRDLARSHRDYWNGYWRWYNNDYRGYYNANPSWNWNPGYSGGTYQPAYGAPSGAAGGYNAGYGVGYSPSANFGGYTTGTGYYSGQRMGTANRMNNGGWW
jgi:hypothetical protein